MLQKLLGFFSTEGFKKYFKNITWVFGGKILQMFSSLIIGVWVTRYLGPGDFGILSYAQSFVALFLALSTLGINGILVRELVREPDKRNALMGSSFALQSIGSLILMSLLLVITYSVEGDQLIRNIILILGSVTFLDSFSIISLHFESEVKSKYSVWVNSSVLIAASIVRLLLITLKAPLIYFVLVIFIESLLTSIGLIFFYHKKGNRIFNWKFSKSTSIRLLKDSWPLVLSSIMVSVYMKVDQIMIKETMKVSFVGQYSAAVRLSEAWYFIPMVISSSLFPAIVNAKKTSEELYYDRIQNLYDLMVLLAVSIALPMTFLSDALIEMLYGKDYYLSGEVLSLHIWAGIFVFLGVSRGGWILNENLQKYTAIYLGIGMICNVMLNFLLIPEKGIIGAAIATLFSQAISVLIAPAFFKKTRISFFMMLKSLTFYSIFNKLKTKK